MTVDNDDSADATFRVLRRLPGATPDAGRSDATRTRCRAVLARAHVHESRRRDRRRRRLLELAIVGAFSL